MNNLEKIKESIGNTLDPIANNLSVLVGNLCNSWSRNEVELSEIRMGCLTILNKIIMLESLEAEYAALDAKAADMMIPQLMDPETIVDVEF